MKNKTTEVSDAVDLLLMEIDDMTEPEKKAELIIAKLPALKRAFGAKEKETTQAQNDALGKVPADASVDVLLKLHEDRKIVEHQQQVRLNTIDRLDRQIQMGKVAGWAGSTIEIFEAMRSMICGSMLAV